MTVQSAEAAAAPIIRNKLGFILLGLLQIGLGIAALAFPFLTTIAAKIFLGWLFLIGGLVQIFHAFQTRDWSEFLLDLLIGILYVAAGAWLAFLPLTGIITLTLLLAFTFIIHGALEVGMAFRLRPHAGWLWMLVAGIVAIAVGIMLIAELPSSATWAIGLLVGVNLIMSGLAYLLLPMAVRS
jgi:uncharacterized membrane protein HdeD (DUF308 family)